MGDAYSTNVRVEIFIQNFNRKNRREEMEDGRIILEWMLGE
jgi:hypothetical protein